MRLNLALAAIAVTLALPAGTTSALAGQHGNMNVLVRVVDSCGAAVGSTSGTLALMGYCLPATMLSVEALPRLAAHARGMGPLASASARDGDLVRVLTLAY